MPVMQVQRTLAAGETVSNVFEGSAFEFARANTFASMAVNCDTAGVFGSIQTGPDLVVEETELFVKTSAPVIPDDFYYSGVAVNGDRIKVSVRNPTGGNVVVTAIAQLTQV